jgi:hypothetical protein
MGGGGTIIIRNAMKQALSDPLVHGTLSDSDIAAIGPILAKDVNDWTHKEHDKVLKVFTWAAQHC